MVFLKKCLDLLLKSLKKPDLDLSWLVLWRIKCMHQKMKEFRNLCFRFIKLFNPIEQSPDPLQVPFLSILRKQHRDWVFAFNELISQKFSCVGGLVVHLFTKLLAFELGRVSFQ